MPPNKQHWKRVQARDQAILDLVRLQHAPVPPEQATKLYGEIKEAVAKLGLPESDADWFYHKMNRDAWHFMGVKILDWRQTVVSWHQCKFFPSLR